MLVFAGKSAFSQGAAARGKPDPILTDNPSGPCDPKLDQADLTPGRDGDGNRVTPADLPGAPITFKGQIAVPLKAASGVAPAYVTVDGSKLDGLLNPKPACK
jgi:hypothetical protein